MKNPQYVMFIERTSIYNRLNKAGVERHVENLRQLDADGKIALCGALKGLKGVAGMVIFTTDTIEEAQALCEREPLVVEGYATYKLYPLMVGNKENNYLL